MKRILLQIFLIATLISCGSEKIKRAEKFYDKWEKDSEPISNEEFEQLGILGQKVYEIYEKMVIDLSSIRFNNSDSNLKYLVLEPLTRVSICDSIVQKTREDNWLQKYKTFGESRPSSYTLRPRSSSIFKILYYSDKYKAILKKRNKFDTPSIFGFKDDSKAFAIFEGRVLYPVGNMHYNSPLIQIGSITFTKNLDEAIVSVSTEFSANKYYLKYDKIRETWSIELFYELMT